MKSSWVGVEGCEDGSSTRGVKGRFSGACFHRCWERGSSWKTKVKREWRECFRLRTEDV